MYIEKTINGFDCRELDYLFGGPVDYYDNAFRYNPEIDDWELFDVSLGRVIARRVNYVWTVM